jgi:hypothetical protein
MPDPTFRTVSASEIAALFDASPYQTRWMLWHRFRDKRDFKIDEDSRKIWGQKLQPLIIDQVTQEKKLQVIPNEMDDYVRRGVLGCTRDAVVLDPDRGYGALEIKCVFDFEVWAKNWGSGTAPPRQNEMQLQQQVFVGDESGSFKWGLIVAWVCSQLYYFERQPIPKLHQEMEGRATEFLASVERNEEPDAFGAPIEVPLLTELYPTIVKKELDLSNAPEGERVLEDLSMYATQKAVASGAKTTTESLRIKLLGIAKDAEYVALPTGYGYRVQKSGKGKTIIPHLPGDF